MREQGKTADAAVSVLPAILAGALAILAGSGMDAAIKHYSATQPLIMIVFWRFALGTALVAIVYFASGRRLTSWQAMRFHAMRGLVHVGAAYLFFVSLGKLALVEATTIGFSAALMIGPFARIVLKEPLSRVSLLAAAIGFVGVIITASGQSMDAALTSDRMIGLAACLVAAALYALSIVLLRARAAIDGGFVVALYANLFPALYMALPALILAPLPSLAFAPVLLAIAAAGTSIWVLMTWAYARGPAARIAPLEYTALLWSAVLGWAFFSEVPGLRLWIGAAVIIAACSLVLMEDRIVGRMTARAAGVKRQ